MLGLGLAAGQRSLSQLERPITVVCTDAETREKVRAIMLDALEQALKNHIIRMHDVWMRDETGQPQRAINGSQQGVNAYIGGRANALKWNPPLC